MGEAPGFLRLLQHPRSDIRDDAAEDDKERLVR
jgi:hypothetical protein